MNLISVAKITDQDYKVVFTKKDARIYNTMGNLSFIAERKGDLYTLFKHDECCTIQVNSPEILKWHYRLGHLNIKDMNNLIRKDVLPSLKVNEQTSLNCEICLKGKMVASPFISHHEPCDEILKIVHSDVVGPFRMHSIEGARYFVTFIDDCTRWCEIYFLREKSDVFEAFKLYQHTMENQTGKRIRYFQSDNGGEYVNKLFDKYFREKGIERRLSIPHTPQQNGVAERMNRTILDMGRCLLLQSTLSQAFWSAAIATACHFRNRCPSRTLNLFTPFQKLNGKRPIIKYFRVFGSRVMILDKNPTKGKLCSRAIEGLFVGYPKECKGYRIWIPDSHKFVVSRDVKFLDEYNLKADNLVEKELLIQNSQENYEHPIIEFPPNQNKPNDILPTISSDQYNHIESDSDYIENDNNEEPLMNNEVIARKGPGRPRIIRTGKIGRPKKQFHFINQNSNEQIENDEVNNNNNNGENDPINETHEDCEMTVFVGHIEVCMNEALKGPNSDEWLDAIESEVTSLIKNEAWDIVNSPNSENIVGCRFILTNKYKADGSIERRKARLVAKGLNQKYGIDYHHTFAPVARLETVRLILALATRFNLKIWQIDVVTAYLHGTLDETVLMKVPSMLDARYRE